MSVCAAGNVLLLAKTDIAPEGREQGKMTLTVNANDVR
jgi:hypothetical protein